MIRLKHNVKLAGLQSQMLLAVQVADSIWRRHNIMECVITSANDSTHKVGSKHYSGCAVDLRSKNIPTTGMKQEILTELREALGPDFDVLLESENTPNEHYHVEFDPEGA